jgi:hypothetical protein
MKERILTGWTFTRALYGIMGVTIIFQSWIHHEWLGVLFGGYFASMGIFAFGCAAGNCIGGNYPVETMQNTKEEIQDNKF